MKFALHDPHLVRDIRGPLHGDNLMNLSLGVGLDSPQQELSNDLTQEVEGMFWTATNMRIRQRRRARCRRV